MKYSKRILGIHASNRKNGNSAIALNELLRAVKDAGHSVEILDLGSVKILPCRGCFGCSGTYRCVLKDDLEELKTKIEAADAIALASPCYYLSAPSPLKAIMDRSASWAINKMAGNKQKKYGVVVSVAGGEPIEFSLQRIFTSLFLGLFGCEITGQLTIGHTFNKGEILLSPSKLKLVSELGENLLHSLEEGRCIKSPINESPDKLTCPNCLTDAFQIYGDGRLVCPVCGMELKRTNEISTQRNFNRFCMEGAQEHRTHIIKNVVRGILAKDEISERLQKYLKFDVLPDDDIEIDIDMSSETHFIKWDDCALNTLKNVVPNTIVEIIKNTISRKAYEEGIEIISNDVIKKYLPRF